MADALSEDGLDIGAERSTRVVRERVTTHVGAGGLGYTEDVGPLLDVLPEVLGIKGRITFKVNVNGLPVGEENITHAVPCQNWNLGRVPVKPGKPLRAWSPYTNVSDHRHRRHCIRTHCCAVLMS